MKTLLLTVAALATALVVQTLRGKILPPWVKADWTD